MTVSDDDRERCPWPGDDALMRQYHDSEWGVPLHDDRRLYEFLILEGAQAGLSWQTILRRREGYRAALEGFDFERVAQYGEGEVARLLADEGIIRNRAKVRSAIQNAGAFIEVRGEFGSFDTFIWQFVDGEPRQNGFTSLDQIPPETEQSKAMSKELKRRGFNFVGPTICYAQMQATGMVNDHLVSCFRYCEVAG
ncbi:MAG: DNA-3-methyladenine glycosylase I [Dehalococcoidia bacterium]|jgi:DNA-3-methyladenine glycosylase I|nr:DNA-3-methyladenine glycosylase I [Dehalococcoidia bacterium]